MTWHFPFRRALPVLALLAALGPAGCGRFTPHPPPPDQIRADAAKLVDPREIVALVPDARAADRLASGAAAAGFVARETRDLPGLGLVMLRFTIPAPLDGAGAIAALEAIEPTATAGVNHAYRPAAVPATTALDYADAMMHWPAQACPAQGPVGMIDTGLDAGLPGLAGLRLVTRSFRRGAATGTAHGSEVALVLADPARLSDVTLYSAAVIGDNGAGPETGVDGLLEALDWMAENHVRLVNVSLAGPYNKLLDRGVTRAGQRGMTIVAAVGNDGPGAAPRYPAAFAPVIAVTAVDAAGAIYRRAVQGAYVDVAAPGVDVALDLGGQPRFVTGTSIATPFVTRRIAGDPALYGASPAAIRRDLGRTARDLGPAGPDPVFGRGLLQAGSGCAG